VGARFHAPRDPDEDVAPAEPSPTGGDRFGRPSFGVERRGYDRRQVDRYVEDAITERARLLAEVEELRRAHDVLLLRLERATVPPPRAPSSVPATATPSGEIAEKLLRTARREALMIRAEAQRAAQSMLEAARADLERERRSPS
jgi:cell division septum initiation protein DivIVA